ncbi:hypothetical protein OKW45_006374 [Paraburkholderia sp. WSM4175]
MSALGCGINRLNPQLETADGKRQANGVEGTISF